MGEQIRSQNPARRALRVLVTHQEPVLDGTVTEADRWVIINPGDDGYEAAYLAAVAAWCDTAIPMPYAQADEPPPNIPVL